MTLANGCNLKKMNERHRADANLLGYEVGFISKKDIKAKKVILESGREVDIPETNGENNFFICNDKEKFIIYYDIYSSRAQKLAKNFFQENYFDEKGERRQNIQDIKEYEKFYFHKDNWPSRKRWNIETEVKKIQGIPINYNHYENLCQTDIDRLIGKLEELVKIMDLYYRSCYALGFNGNMNINCSVFGSLPKMVIDICDCFAIEKPEGIQEEIVRYIEDKIPNTIDAMMLSK